MQGEGTSLRREHKREELRLVRLSLEYGDGNGMEVELLRSLAWLEESRAAVIGMVRLDLRDVGVSGWARVQAVEDCPELEEGEGPLVTGWFKRRSSEVYDLVVQGEAESIGITATHPVWSVDCQAWVSAIELRKGERLLAEDGSTPRMVSLSLRPGREAVYNIEVEGEHCYRVGQQGLLVHNQSGPSGQTIPATTPSTCDCRLATYRAAHPTVTGLALYVFQQEMGRPGANWTVRTGMPQTLWGVACAVHYASVPSTLHNDTTIAVGLVCLGGTEFQVIVSCNQPSIAADVQQAAATESAGFAAPTGDGRHAEEVLIDYVIKGGGSIVAVAASRCICDTCGPLIMGSLAEAVSPVGGPTAFYVCRAGSISQAAGAKCGTG